MPAGSANTLNRWWVVVGSALGLAVSNGPIVVYTFGIFFTAIVAEFGWPRSSVGLAVTLFLVCRSITMPLFGAAIDRWGIPRPQIVSILLTAPLLAAVSFTNSLTAFWLIFAAIGIVSCGQTGLPYTKAVASWFDERRGLALGLALTGTGVGGALLPIFAQHVLDGYGWRTGYIALAVLVAAVALPVSLFLVREAPRSPSRAPAATSHEVGRGAWKVWALDPTFWLIVLPITAVFMVTSGMLVHMMPLLGDHKIASEQAVAIVSGSSLASAAGRAGAGYLLDRCRAPAVAAVIFTITALGFLLLGTDSVVLLFIAAAILGVGLGAEMDLLSYLISRYFPLRSYGRVGGIAFLFTTNANGLGAYLMGLCFDLTGSYLIALLSAAATCAVAAAFIWRLGPYRNEPRRPATAPPVQVPEGSAGVSRSTAS